MVLRWQTRHADSTTFWQRKDCLQAAKKDDVCKRQWERDNYLWERHRMMEDYLQGDNEFTHVLLLDADASPMRPELNTLGRMASMLVEEGKDVLITVADWVQRGAGRVSSAVTFARKAPFALKLFQDMLDAHELGHKARDRGPGTWRLGLQNVSCDSSEESCLNALLGFEPVIKGVHVASGRRFNRGGCTLTTCSVGTVGKPFSSLGLRDPELEVMHFTGISRKDAAAAICGELMYNLTGEGAQGYGCKDFGT